MTGEGGGQDFQGGGKTRKAAKMDAKNSKNSKQKNTSTSSDQENGSGVDSRGDSKASRPENPKRMKG